MRWMMLPIAIALVARGAGSQSPRVTPAGDPSVKSDTIYSLAVKPADYADRPYVFLLDDGVVKFEADGTGSRTYRQVVQILTPEAAERWGEQSFPYSTDKEKFTLNWARVVRPDGSVVSEKPVHEQESLAPVAMEAPVYSDEKLHRISLGGVAPGTIVDYSYTVQTLKPVIPGDFFTTWSVTTGTLTRRSRLIVDLPASVKARIQEHHLSFARKEVTTGGRRIYTWARTEVPKPEVEPLAPDSSFGESLVIASPIKWGDIATWYSGLAKDRYALTPEIEQALAHTVANAKTLDDSVRAVHRWVAQDYRYVSLSLGLAGFQPHSPSEVFANNYGDCKDKATFFIALMKKMGVTAYPVLLSSFGGVIRTLPTGHQFNHMIAAVDLKGHRTYVDLTADIVPYGSLPPQEQGEFGLVVHPDGSSEEITFPTDPQAGNKTEMHLVGSLTPDGLFAGKWTHVRIRRAAVLAPRLDVEVDEAGLHRARANDARDRERDLRGIGRRQPAALRWTRSGCRAEGLDTDPPRKGRVERRRHRDPDDSDSELRGSEYHLCARGTRYAEVSDRRREGVGPAHGDGGAQADAARGLEGEAPAERHGVERVRHVRGRVHAEWSGASDRAKAHRHRGRVAGHEERRAAGVDEEDVGG